MSKKIEFPDELRLWPVEWLKIIPLREIKQFNSLSVDSLKRHHADKLVDLGPRRKGMRVGHALMLGAK
jgi:hypothetical protein